MIRTALLILIGGVPAALAFCFAILVTVLGLAYFWADPSLNWLMVTALGALGILGTAAIWFAAFRRTNLTIAVGLVCGIYSIGATWTGTTVGVFRVWPFPIGEYMTFGPVIVAIGLLVEFAFEQTARIRTQRNKDSKR